MPSRKRSVVRSKKSRTLRKSHKKSLRKSHKKSHSRLIRKSHRQKRLEEIIRLSQEDENELDCDSATSQQECNSLKDSKDNFKCKYNLNTNTCDSLIRIDCNSFKDMSSCFKNKDTCSWKSGSCETESDQTTREKDWLNALEEVSLQEKSAVHIRKRMPGMTPGREFQHSSVRLL